MELRWKKDKNKNVSKYMSKNVSIVGFKDGIKDWSKM